MRNQEVSEIHQTSDTKDAFFEAGKRDHTAVPWRTLNPSRAVLSLHVATEAEII